MINEEEIKFVAQLARLKLEKEEEKLLVKDLLTILEYVNQLAQIDVSSIKIESDIRPQQQREDKVKLSLAKPDDLLSLAPARQDRYIQVKSVFKYES